MSEKDKPLDVRPKKTRKTGVWFIKGNEPRFIEEITTEQYNPILSIWEVIDKTTVEKTPKDFGWSKEAETLIILRREIPSLETFEGIQTVFYKQQIKYQIRDDRTFVYLKLEGNKVFIRDFYWNITLECGKNTNRDVVITKSETKRITVDEIRKLAKEGKISEIYTRIIDEPSGRMYGKGGILKPKM